MNRIAVVDLGSNSTRLLVADVDGDTLTQRLRRSTVTRLGQGVDAHGALADEAMQRVYAVLDEYRALVADSGAQRTIGVLTSAVRDAANGAEFTAAVRDRYGIDARTIAGEEEARLTYRGAMNGRSAGTPTAVIDIGGGSTELIVGTGREPDWRTSTQIGVVRHTERHLHVDPPSAAQLAALRADAAEAFAAAIPAGVRPAAAIAVAGTATQSAAMLGHDELARDQLESLLGRLAAVGLEQRLDTPGLDPARAPTIVAGVAILLESLAALGLDRAEASDDDILVGAALEHSAF